MFFPVFFKLLKVKMAGNDDDLYGFSATNVELLDCRCRDHPGLDIFSVEVMSGSSRAYFDSEKKG